MIKVYFDWNCISHSKDQFPYLLSLVKTYSKYVICPFSLAHIRDALVSRASHPQQFEEDIVLLSQFSQQYYLWFDGKQVLPRLATPMKCVEAEGNLWEKLQTMEWISPKIYHDLKKSLQKLMPPQTLSSIQKENDPLKALELIENYIHDELRQTDLLTFMNKNNLLPQLSTVESQFKSVCMGLDIFGYKSEGKDKSIMNIDADAAHIFMAGHCDYLVSNDRKLCAKANALYRKFNYQTQVISPEELEDKLKTRVFKGFDKDYILSCITQYDHARQEVDGAHYKLLPYDVFGLFNVCFSGSSLGSDDGDTTALFSYSFNRTPYLFNHEIECFFDMILSFLTPAAQTQFRNAFIAPFEKGDKASCQPFFIDISSWNVTLKVTLDPNQEGLVPAMQVFVK